MIKHKKKIMALLFTLFLNILSSFIYALIQKVDFFTAFKIIMKNIFNFAKNILTFNFQLWQVLVIIFILFFIKEIIKNNREVNEIPDYMSYTTDFYEGICYKWRIVRILDDKFSLEDFRPVCDCGAELTMKYNYKNIIHSTKKLFCVNCKKFIDCNYDYEIHNDAKLYFENKLRKKIDCYKNSR